jgi:Uma2 family endonuclease
MRNGASMPRTGSKRKRGGLVSGNQLFAMGDIGPCELVKGKIVCAKPAFFPHGVCVGRFYHELFSFVDPRKLGTVAVGEVGIYTELDPDTVRGADVIFISSERLVRAEADTSFLRVAPDLVVEVVSSPSTRAKARRKVPEYLACGVRLVWVADLVRRTIHAYRSIEDVRTFQEGDLLPGDDVLPGFSVPVARLFG